MLGIYDKKQEWKNNRLAVLWHEFALEFRLFQRMDAESIGGDLIIPASKSINVKYDFDESEKSYVFGASLRGLPENNLSDYALAILQSDPLIGLTERFINGKLVVLGGRNGLDNVADKQIINYFMDDVARIVAYFNRL